MARIRTVKPEFFTSEDIVALPALTRLLYIALWCESDKEGRMLWKPKTFKMRYFPADDCDVGAMCDALVKAGLVILYGDGLAYIPSFAEHQHINPRETPSKLPAPSDASPTRKPRVTSATVTHREEGKGREGKQHASKPRESVFPEDFKITPDLIAWAKEKGYSRLEDRLEHFRGWALAKGARYTDWTQAFQNAIRGDWAKLGVVPADGIGVPYS